MHIGLYFLLLLSFGMSTSCFAGNPTAQERDSMDANSPANDSPQFSLLPYVDQIRNLFQLGIVQGLAKDAAYNMLSTANISQICLIDTEQVIEDLSTGQNYAQKFVDADAKIPPGILQGQWAWLGDYEQCYAIESPYTATTRRMFRGRYSNIMLYRNGEPVFQGVLPLAIGVCLPDTCDKLDVHAIASAFTAPLSEFNVTVAFVEMDEEYSYSAGAIVFFLISGILVLLVIIWTLVDTLHNTYDDQVKQIHGVSNEAFRVETGNDLKGEFKETVIHTESRDALNKQAGGMKAHLPKESNGKWLALNGHVNTNVEEHSQYIRKPFMVKCLISFSILNNTSKLLNTSTANGPLACLNGLRVLSIWWVIQGHTYSYIMFGLDNVAYAEKTLKSRFTFQAILNASFSVDTFFFLSGLLVTYLALKEWKKRGRMNWLYYFGHRYWRLTPVYAFVLLFFVSLVYEHLLYGPFQWLAASPNGLGYKTVELCKSYWWTNLLYFNNLYPDYGSTTSCMGWSWYLANDMQFYVIVSPILLILLYKKRIVGWLVSGTLVVLCVITRGILVSHYGILGVDGSDTKHTDDPWGDNALYAYPWTRVSVYVIGMVTGYFLYEKKCKFRLNRIVSAIGWSVCIATAMCLVYGLHNYYAHDNEEMSLTASWFYNAFDRTAWALCLTWITIACVSGYGGWVNSILSWKIWAPLGRLTYSAYLVHPIIIIIFSFSVTSSPHFTDLTMVSSFVAYLVMSYGCAYVVSMVAEAPMMQLEKCILNRGT